MDEPTETNQVRPHDVVAHVQLVKSKNNHRIFLVI